MGMRNTTDCADFEKDYECAKIVEGKIKKALTLQGFKPGGRGEGGWPLNSGEWDEQNASLEKMLRLYPSVLSDEEITKRKEEEHSSQAEADKRQDKDNHLDIVYWRFKPDESGLELIAGDVKADTLQATSHNFFFETHAEYTNRNKLPIGWGLTTHPNESRFVIVVDNSDETGGHDAKFPQLWITKYVYLRSYYEQHKGDMKPVKVIINGEEVKKYPCREARSKKINKDGSTGIGRLIPEVLFAQEYGYYHIPQGNRETGYAPIEKWGEHYKGNAEKRFPLPFPCLDFKNDSEKNLWKWELFGEWGPIIEEWKRSLDEVEALDIQILGMASQAEYDARMEEEVENARRYDGPSLDDG